METENRLPKEFKEKWLEALRSGKYEQGTGTLYGGEGYCCLGVACMVANPEVEPPYDEFIRGGVHKNIYPSLPSLLVGDEGIAKELANMNDGEYVGERIVTPKKNFKEIADWIETNL